jgi:hypothetical protein
MLAHAMPLIDKLFRKQPSHTAHETSTPPPGAHESAPGEAKKTHAHKGIAGMALPELPATSLQKQLATRGASLTVVHGSDPKPTLSLDEIVRADPKERGDLMRRYAALGGFIAEKRAGVVSTPPRLDVPGLKSDGKTVTINGVKLGGVKGANGVQEQTERALACLLPEIGKNAAAVEMMAYLFGTDGVLLRRPGDLDVGADKFSQPLFFAWDYNGTVERDTNLLRSGMADTLHALNRMGSASALTTTMAPEGAEKMLVKEQVPFVSYYGGHDVRPLPGNKVYEGIAASFGVAPDEAKKKMVVFGDSVTDAALDMPGVLHVQLDATVPGPALEMLLHAIDKAFPGDVSKGVEALVGQPLHAGQAAEVQVGPLRFVVEMRSPKEDPRAKHVSGPPAPIIHSLQIELANDQVAALLAGKAETFGDQRAQRLAFHHLADSMNEQNVADAIHAAKGAGAGKVLDDAVAARRALRQYEVDDATRFITSRKTENGMVVPSLLEQSMELPLRMDDLIRRLIPLVQVGDPNVTQALHDALGDFGAKQAGVEERAHAALNDYAGMLHTLIDSAAVSTSRSLKKPTPDQEQALAVLVKLVQHPVPLDASSQNQVLGLLAQIVKEPPPGAASLFARLKDSIAEELAICHREVSERFQERNARAGELVQGLEYADALTAQRQASWRDIESAAAKKPA